MIRLSAREVSKLASTRQRKKDAIRSKCCAAPVKVGGERSTHWYICEKCGKACDAK